MPDLTPDVARQAWAAAEATGHATNAEPFAPCPADCTETEDHRHYQREPGVYYELREPVDCCGRRWARLDETFWLDQCRWCWTDHGTLVLKSLVRLVPTVAPIRDRRGRR